MFENPTFKHKAHPSSPTTRYRRKKHLQQATYPTPQDLAKAIANFDDSPKHFFCLILWKDGGFSIRGLGDFEPDELEKTFMILGISGGKGLMGPKAAADPQIVNDLYAKFEAYIFEFMLKSAGIDSARNWLARKYYYSA